MYLLVRHSKLRSMKHSQMFPYLFGGAVQCLVRSLFICMLSPKRTRPNIWLVLFGLWVYPLGVLWCKSMACWLHHIMLPSQRSVAPLLFLDSAPIRDWLYPCSGSWFYPSIIGWHIQREKERVYFWYAVMSIYRYVRIEMARHECTNIVPSQLCWLYFFSGWRFTKFCFFCALLLLLPA